MYERLNTFTNCETTKQSCKLKTAVCWVHGFTTLKAGEHLAIVKLYIN